MVIELKITVKLLCKYIPWTLLGINTYRLQRCHSIPFFIAVLEGIVCRMWSSPDTTGVPSICAEFFGQVQHFPDPTIILFPTSLRWNPTRPLSQMCPSMATMLEKVCGFKSVLFRRTLNAELMCVVLFFLWHILFIATAFISLGAPAFIRYFTISCLSMQIKFMEFQNGHLI